jgi:dimeric dUTPase (all-alpha-NTP-PPase superfamily)
LINYKPENEEPKNEEQDGKENYKLTLGFIKSLTSKLNKSNIIISNDEERANLKNQLQLLSGAISNYMDKSVLK